MYYFLGTVRIGCLGLMSSLSFSELAAKKDLGARYESWRQALKAGHRTGEQVRYWFRVKVFGIWEPYSFVESLLVSYLHAYIFEDVDSASERLYIGSCARRENATVGSVAS